MKLTSPAEFDQCNFSANFKDRTMFHCPPFIARAPKGSVSNLISCTNPMYGEVDIFSNFADANLIL